jgi:hypothetical protein
MQPPRKFVILSAAKNLLFAGSADAAKGKQVSSLRPE